MVIYLESVTYLASAESARPGFRVQLTEATPVICSEIWADGHGLPRDVSSAIGHASRAIDGLAAARFRCLTAAARGLLVA